MRLDGLASVPARVRQKDGFPELTLSLIHISEAHETSLHLVCRLLLEKNDSFVAQKAVSYTHLTLPTTPYV